MPEPGLTLVLVATGIAGGILSYVVGLASLVTYPVLLALGLPAVSANVTNTVALAFTGAGSALGARRELHGQGPLLARLAFVAIAGGAAGAFLLLVLPGRWFELVAPILIGAAGLAILAQPGLRSRGDGRPRGLTPPTAAIYFATAVYIGYFGAGGGILSLVALVAIIDRPLMHVNAAKAVLSSVVNATAALGFVLFGPVHWSFILPLAGGLVVGGYIGPAVTRRLPEAVLRALVAASGLAVAVLLAVRTYGA